MFIFTQHAIEKMDALGVDRATVERAIRNGMKWKESKEEKWHAQMAGIEAVFQRQEKEIVVITVYEAGRKK
ncbi:DUF4258 domain-containing protein [Candidatus Woesearchaeota archaeon]|nr:DUF4258 domain-containing protein [Candidatus Woesearchaeota archaeon]